MKVTKRQLALLAVARRRLDIGEALWREALAELGGVESAKELDREGFDAVLGWLESCGFRIEAPAANFGTRPGFASPAQLGLIRSRWRQYTRYAYAGDKELEKWLAAKFKVSSLRFLTAEAAPKVITALKSMEARARAARAGERKTATA